MIVLDTHAWIWWLSDPGRLSKSAAEAIRDARAIGVSAISCWEVAMLVERQKIALDRDVLDWLEEALAQPRVELLPLTPAISVRSTKLGHGFHGDPADRIIVATAVELSADLISRDDRIRAYPATRCVW